MNMPFVEIVGAGPGAEDLITVRGLLQGPQAAHGDEVFRTGTGADDFHKGHVHGQTHRER